MRKLRAERDQQPAQPHRDVHGHADNDRRSYRHANTDHHPYPHADRHADNDHYVDRYLDGNPDPPPATASSSTAASPAAGSGSGSLLWLWILLGVLVLATLIALIARSARHRSAAAADWQSRLIDAYAKGSALHDAMSVAESPGAMTAADAGARWADIQRRADDLAQTLYALREAVPDPGDQARISDTLASLQAARSAMDAERALGGASPEQAETIRNRLYVFESSLRALRARDDRYP